MLTLLPSGRFANRGPRRVSSRQRTKGLRKGDSAIDEIRRQTGDIVAAMQLARHESVATTQTYLHPTQEDLIARMKQVIWT